MSEHATALEILYGECRALRTRAETAEREVERLQKMVASQDKLIRALDPEAAETADDMAAQLRALATPSTESGDGV